MKKFKTTLYMSDELKKTLELIRILELPSNTRFNDIIIEALQEKYGNRVVEFKEKGLI